MSILFWALKVEYIIQQNMPYIFWASMVETDHVRRNIIFIKETKSR